MSTRLMVRLGRHQSRDERNEMLDTPQGDSVPDQMVDSSPELGARGGVRMEGVSKTFESGDGDNLVLDDVSLSVDRGEFVSLIGPSGCGKSTLLKLLAGLLEPDTGTIVVDGESVRAATRHKSIGLVPQSPALLPWRDVLSNVSLPLKLGRKTDEPRSLRDPVELLESMGLGHALKRYPAELSGGMQQRVAIARAFVFDPGVLLMDEPFSALDELNRDHQRMGLLRFWQSNRKAVVFVTHSVPEAVILSDRIIVMAAHPGRIIGVVDVHLPRPRDSEIFDNPEFSHVERRVRALLREASELGGESEDV
jgi:NitT/TauT family transport system ATP-binding protein